MASPHIAECASHTGLQCDCFIVERTKALDDAKNFGTGFTRTKPDGTVEHIPVDQVTIFTRPNNQEA